MCKVLAVLLGLVMTAASAVAQSPTADPALIEDLVAANRILYDQGVVDGFGHVSVRHDKNPEHFLLARSMAPGLVTAADLMEFDRDGNAIDPTGRAVILNDLFTARFTRPIPRSRGRAQPLAGGDPVRGGPASSFGRDCFVSQCAPRNDTPNLAEVAEISAGQGLSYKFVLEAPSFSTHLLARLGSYGGCSLASHQ